MAGSKRGRLMPQASYEPALSEAELTVLGSLSDEQKLTVAHAIRLVVVESKARAEQAEADLAALQAILRDAVATVALADPPAAVPAGFDVARAEQIIAAITQGARHEVNLTDVRTLLLAVVEPRCSGRTGLSGADVRDENDATYWRVDPGMAREAATLSRIERGGQMDAPTMLKLITTVFESAGTRAPE